VNERAQKKQGSGEMNEDPGDDGQQIQVSV
jgi:hypothetical protein